MKFRTNSGERIVIANAVRTPFGQAGKSLSKLESFELTSKLIEYIFSSSALKKKGFRWAGFWRDQPVIQSPKRGKGVSH